MMSSERIGIFVATMTGVAEMCAEEIAAAFTTAGRDSDTILMNDLEASALDAYDTVVVVSSTYGHGDIPDNGQALYDSIAACGKLQGKRFAVFGLGDMTFAGTFCEAGEKWFALLEAKGAQPIVPLVRHDASSGTLAEDEAAVWAKSWIGTLRLAA